LHWLSSDYWTNIILSFINLLLIVSFSFWYNTKIKREILFRLEFKLSFQWKREQRTHLKQISFKRMFTSIIHSQDSSFILFDMRIGENKVVVAKPSSNSTFIHRLLSLSLSLLQKNRRKKPLIGLCWVVEISWSFCWWLGPVVTLNKRKIKSKVIDSIFGIFFFILNQDVITSTQHWGCTTV
jgi:hypothetical protein